MTHTSKQKSEYILTSNVINAILPSVIILIVIWLSGIVWVGRIFYLVEWIQSYAQIIFLASFAG